MVPWAHSPSEGRKTATMDPAWHPHPGHHVFMQPVLAEASKPHQLLKKVSQKHHRQAPTQRERSGPPWCPGEPMCLAPLHSRAARLLGLCRGCGEGQGQADAVGFPQEEMRSYGAPPDAGRWERGLLRGETVTGSAL